LEFEAQKECPGCGVIIEEGEIDCPSCGTSFEDKSDEVL
jgi:RNA polymerase subunit RPABC4/transcription elongation factor Spt4